MSSGVGYLPFIVIPYEIRRQDGPHSGIHMAVSRSRNDIQQSYIREWQKTTARDGNINPQTILSTLWFVPIWLKYHAVPDILRYAWYMVWLRIVATYKRYHTWAIVQGAYPTAHWCATVAH